MNFLKHPGEGDGAFHIAPLLDIVFIVLVFFIVTTTMTQAEKHMTIKSPTATSSEDPTRQPHQIVINVDRHGMVVVNNTTWEMETLAERLKLFKELTSGTDGPPISVIIRADGRTWHQNVVNVMDACIAADIQQMWFVTVDKK